MRSSVSIGAIRLDSTRFCWRLGTPGLEEMQQNFMATLAESMARGRLKRETGSTEGFAVGSREFVERIQPQIRAGRESEPEEAALERKC